MSDTPHADAPQPTSTPHDGEDQDVTVDQLKAEVDKWRAMSRKNEKSFKDASRELDQARQAAMSDQDKALEQARQEARTSALAEAGERIAMAELRAQAAQNGVSLPGAEFLNLRRFVDADGSADAEAITAFVSALPTTNPAPAYRQDLGLGRQQSGSAGQLTRTDLARMNAKQINAAREAGRLNDLMHGGL
ncbi:hypothetical protein [Streptomyces rimosus]|uniref:hypothetical protein n=1 Tax=Streptomyces rimosus TaxID=1927 RepID=UPI00067BFD64|nr:hypothetical protein [Streptomyces rimosus]